MVFIIQLGPIPKHIGFIMDGNRRFAKRRNLPGFKGHGFGFKQLERTLEWSLLLGIKTITIYAFSIDNFKRPTEEVDAIFDLAEEKFEEFLNKKSLIYKNGICVRFIGDLSLLRPSTREIACRLMWETRGCKNAILNIACPYTSTEELSTAAKILKDALDTGKLLDVDISQHLMDQTLYTCDQYPLDILVRTSGEVRLSNFMLWQASRDCYIHFVDVLWPEFSFWDMMPILLCFQCNYVALEKINVPENISIMSEVDDEGSELLLLPASYKRKERNYLEILKAFIPLSLSSFGGPSAHVSMFLEKFVTQEKWITEKVFTELFAISQSLPGPASTQLGYSIALLRGGILCGLLSFICWSIPGMFVMIGFAYGINKIGNSLPLGFQYVSNGLTSAALGLVALAAFKLSTKLLSTPTLVIIGVISASLAINFPTISWLYPVMIICGGLVTYLDSYLSEAKNFRFEGVEEPVVSEENGNSDSIQFESGDANNIFHTSLKTGVVALILWLLLLILSIVFKSFEMVPLFLRVFGNLYFAGSIIFGGGPVVIALLQSWFVDETLWMTNREFLLGLALINSMPGPNFNLGAFCGALAMRSTPATLLAGGVIGWAGIFSPGLLLMTGLIPLWKKYRSLKYVNPVFAGVNAAAVGLIIAAIYILQKKAIVIPSDDSVGAVDQLSKYPLYTSVAAISYALAGFTPLSAPFAIAIGGVVGLLHWISTW